MKLQLYVIVLLGLVSGCAFGGRALDALEYAAGEAAGAAADHAGQAIEEALLADDPAAAFRDWGGVATGTGITAALVAVLAFARHMLGRRGSNSRPDDEDEAAHG